MTHKPKWRRPNEILNPERVRDAVNSFRLKNPNRRLSGFVTEETRLDAPIWLKHSGEAYIYTKLLKAR